jgi:hypothetical protein
VDGDFMFDPPSEKQFEMLTALVRTLQQACDIPADRVYLHGELVPQSRSPGEAFPVEQFNRRLLSPRP